MNLRDIDLNRLVGFWDFVMLKANLDLSLSDRNYIQATPGNISKKWSHPQWSVNSWETTTASMYEGCCGQFERAFRLLLLFCPAESSLDASTSTSCRRTSSSA